jgi:hypothetical protein
MTHIKHLYRGKRRYAYYIAITVPDKYIPYFKSLNWEQDTIFYDTFHTIYQFLDKRKINRILSKFNKNNQEDIRLHVSQIYNFSFPSSTWIYRTFPKDKKK